MIAHRHLLILALFHALGGAALAAEPARDRHGDPLPDGAVTRLGELRLRQGSVVLDAVFLSGGKELMAAGDEGTIVRWDSATGRKTRQYKLDRFGRPQPLRFTSDGGSLVVAGDDGALRILHAATGAERRKIISKDRSSILALNVSGDGKTAVTIDSSDTVTVWDLAAGKRLHELRAPDSRRQWTGQAIALTPDGKQLVLPHADGTLHLLNAGTGAEVLAFETPPSDHFQTVALSPNGRYLACGSVLHAATLCELKTGKRLRQLATPDGVSGLAFTPDSRFLVVGDIRGLSVFDVVSGKQVRRFARASGAGRILVLSPDGRLLASVGPGPAVGSGHVLDLWNLAGGASPPPPAGHRAPVHSIAFSPDGKRLVSAGNGGDVIVWDIATGRDLAHHLSLSVLPDSLRVAGDGETVEYLAVDRAAYRWHPRRRGEAKRIAQSPDGARSVALSPDGRSLAVMTFLNAPLLQLQETTADRRARTLPLPDRVWVNRLVFSPDSERLAAACSDGALRLWHRDTGVQLHEWAANLPTRLRPPLAFAADWRTVVVFDDRLRIREIAGGGERLQIPRPEATSTFAYSPNGRFVACGHPDGRISLFGTETGKRLTQWQGRQGYLRALTFSPDSRLLASGGADGTIFVWKVPEGGGLPGTLKVEEAEARWRELADLDAGVAGRAGAALSAAPAQAVPLIKERFRAEYRRLAPKEITDLIADLDADAFKVRERATLILKEAGADAAEALRGARAANPSPEARRRIESLLDRLHTGDPERLRCLRALEILDRIGTPEARNVLRELSRKPLPADLADEVRASLRRMGDRP